MGGDCKCPLNPSIDKKGGLLNPRKAVTCTIGSFVEDLDLVDIWRVTNPEKKSFTWSQNSLMIFCRLDYWLSLNALHNLVKVSDIIPAMRTDHSPITLEFVNTLKIVKGPGVWKMNRSLLDDKEYIYIYIYICLNL